MKSLKGARGCRTLFGTVLLGEELAVKPGFTAEKSGKKGDRCRASWGEWDTTGQRTVPCLEGRMQQSFCGDSVGS